MKIGMEFRVYPTKKQKALIDQTFDCCINIYNWGLTVRTSEDGKHLTYEKTSAMMTQMKKKDEFAFLREVDSIALQQSLRDLDIAFKRYYDGISGFPRKKRRRSYGSYRTINQRGSVYIEGSRIRLPKIGYLKIKKTREVGKIFSVTVKRTSSVQYYVVITTEAATEPVHTYGKEIGIDLGLKDLYMDNNGYNIPNNKFLYQDEEKLKREKRKLQHMIKSHIVGYKVGVNGGHIPIYDRPLVECKNVEKQRLRVAKIYESIRNKRMDFLHKESRKLIMAYSFVGVEDLDVKGMGRQHTTAKAVSDASWATFIQMLEYKAELYGSKVVKVPRYFKSSQRCSCCGTINPAVKDLNIREWTCPVCYAEHHRDVNAAKNILMKAEEISEHE